MWRSLRIYVILFISISGLVLTQYWYTHSHLEVSGASTKPVAFIHENINEVEQKHFDHLIWKSVKEGQILYHGDTVRTGVNAQTEVVFTKSGSSIFVNQGSQIVIDEREGQITLNLLSGSLLAKGGENAPVVVAGKSKIRLEKAKTELAVAVSEKKVLSGCVFSGAMSLEKDALRESVQSGNCSEKTMVSVISPRPNASISRSGRSGVSTFEFVGYKTPYEADLYIGSKKTALAKVASIQGRSEKGFIQAVAPEGVFYWQIVTREGAREVGRSLVYQSEMNTVTAPSLLSPQESSVLVADESTMRVNFNWLATKYASKFRFEISKDANFEKGRIFDKQLEAYENPVLLPKDQMYYWRVTAYWKDSRLAPLISPVNKFTIRSNIKLTAPSLNSPREGENYAEKSLTKNWVVFQWSSVPGAKSYTLQVVSPNGKASAYETNGPSYRLNSLLAGEYKWSVQSKNNLGPSPMSSSRTFRVISYFPIKWIEPSFSETESETEKPSLNLQWSGVPGVYQWAVTYNNPAFKTNFASRFVMNKGALILNGLGKWTFVVNGFDQGKNVIAQSEPRSVTFAPPKLLPAPPLRGVVNRVITGLEDGTLSISWDAVKKGKSYIVSLIGEGKEGLAETDKTEFRFKKLKSGEYTLRIQTKNSLGKLGPYGTSYKVIVPQEKGAPPPQIKRIVVH